MTAHNFPRSPATQPPSGVVGDTSGDAFQARATHEPSQLRRLGLSVGIAIALAGCEVPKDTPLAWYEQPNDPQVYAYAFDRCLNSTRGPSSTRYNDWDEAIAQCQNAAEKMSRYCPNGARCSTEAVGQSQVRAILPEAAQ